MIVKFQYGPEYPGCEDKSPCTIYGDVSSVTFPDPSGTSNTARLWVREPVKTALVPGFCENERNVDLGEVTYVMNDAGKTISTYRREKAS